MLVDWLGICWVGDQLWDTEVGEPCWKLLACLPPVVWLDPLLPDGLRCFGPGGWREMVVVD